MPTVTCPRCKNETLVLNYATAVKHCSACGGVLPEVAPSSEDRRRSMQSGLEDAVERMASEHPPRTASPLGGANSG